MEKRSAELLGAVYDKNDPDASNVSYWNTVNPFASAFGGNIRIPEFVAKMFGSSVSGRRTAAIVSNAVGSAGLIAAAVMGMRGLSWLSRLGGMRKSNNPFESGSKQLGTTFEINDGEDKEASLKTASYNSYRDSMSGAGPIVAGAAVPLLAALAGAVAYKASDSTFDTLRNKRLDKSVDSRSKTVTELVKIRAKLANGTLSPEEALAAVDSMNMSDGMVKKSNLLADKLYGIKSSVSEAGDKVVQYGGGGLAMLLLAVLGASAIGAHYYFSANDKGNQKFEAYKKALQEYAKSKAMASPITIARPSQALIDEIEGDGGDKDKPARESAEVDFGAVSKPVSITL